MRNTSKLLTAVLLSLLLVACSDSGKTKSSGRTTQVTESTGGYDVGSLPSSQLNISGSFQTRQRQLSAMINKIAREVGVDPFFVHAIISAESAYKPGAKSHAGAMGLMQLMPGTARRFNVSSPFVPEQNVRGGATYLKWLLKEFGGDMQLAAAGYNAGEGNVRKYGRKIPPFIETRAYVPKVMAYYKRYRANPHEIGLGNVESPTTGSGCDARELC
ncbi:lytic transglycosylase domain-containing protein [Cardiobacterium valvarum]|uniref:Transglycosylase SLT domain protein n=1 Tax=Cardiobacterium valvarum F0432 TaxID=797473 RepID=G9ZGA3_9GAMM|nr:lytic transglycosylase domain-containing protein [Cardiobacterium valvarum]EHM53343.1 transglycosylase SLT domain protein [Cardiobacterium valvarum F0432]